MVTRGSVLVVDDEVNLCRILGAKLAKSGYDVVAVHDGLQAVQKVRESDFDVVLLDLILPKMDGLTALAKIRSLRTALPVIVMTACENPEALEQAKGHGVSAYVNKPFDLDTLVSLVRDTTECKTACPNRKLPESTVLFIKDRPVTLEIQNGSGVRVYSSSIYDKDDRTVSVLAPATDEGILEVAPRTSVRVGLAANDAYYNFTSRVLRSNSSPEHVLVLDKPGVIYRAQRREHARLPLRIPVQYAACQEDAADEPAFHDGETRDISLGGACIVVPEEVLPGEMLQVRLRPKSSKDVVSAVAQVLRAKPSEQPGEAGYVLGCRFTHADKSLRKLLEG